MGRYGRIQLLLHALVVGAFVPACSSDSGGSKDASSDRADVGGGGDAADGGADRPDLGGSDAADGGTDRPDTGGGDATDGGASDVADALSENRPDGGGSDVADGGPV